MNINDLYNKINYYVLTGKGETIPKTSDGFEVLEIKDHTDPTTGEFFIDISVGSAAQETTYTANLAGKQSSSTTKKSSSRKKTAKKTTDATADVAEQTAVVETTKDDQITLEDV